MKKRLISFVLTVVMLVSLCTVFTASASAEPAVTTVSLPSGGSVVKLCEGLGVNYYAHKNLIMSLNNITSESQFYKLSAGTPVVLPVNEAAAASLEGGTAAATPLSAGTLTAAGTTAAAGTTPAGQTTALPAGDSVAYYLVWYSIQRGQTIDSIYRDWGLNYRTYDNQIRKLNNISSYNSLVAGKTYLLPTTNPAVANSAYYTVMAHTMRAGEYAYDIITNQYTLNYNQIQQMTLALNNTSDLSYVGANTTLYIPVSGIVSPSTTVSPTTAAVTTTATVSTSANYNLVSQTTVNGSFALMVDNNVVTTAQAGKIVTVVATPDVGYGIDMIRVTKVGDASSAVAVNNNCFVMPNYSVIVSVTFKSVPAYKINVESSKEGSVVAMVNGSAVTQGYLGSSVSVRAIPKAGFMLDTVRVTYNNKKDSVAVENNMFVMPATDVTVTASFVSDPDYDPSKGNLISVDANYCEVKTFVGTEEVRYAKKGEVVAVNVVPYANYTVTSLKIYNSDYSKIIATDKYGFTMPDGPVNVVVEAKPTVSASFPINVVDPVNGDVVVMVNETEADSAIVGQTVTVYGYETMPAYNYLTTVYKTNEPTVAVPVEQNDDGSASFVMPDFEVTVRVKFYTYYNVYTHASNGLYGTYGIVWSQNPYVAIDKAGAGVELMVTFGYIEPGYSVSEIMLVYADGSTYTLDGNTFIMPDCDVIVKVNFAPSQVVRAYSITENDTDKATVYPHWGNIYAVGGVYLNDLKDYYLDVEVADGSTVTVTPYAEIGYQFDKFVINYKDPDGNFQSKTYTYLDKNPTTLKYQFTMPKIMDGTVVELMVYFKEVRTYSITQDYTNACDPANIDMSNADHHMGTFGFMTVYDNCDHAAEDTKLYIISSANTGYRADLSGVKIYKANSDGTYTDVTNDPDVNYDPTNYSFFMPTYDVKVYVPFTESMFWVNLEKSFDSSKGLARGELTLVVNGVHFTEETLTLTGTDKNNTRKVFDAGVLMKIVNTSNEGYILNSKTPFSIYRVDKNGNYISADLAKSLMVDGSTDTFVMPPFNISVKANYDDEVVAIVKAPCEHGSFTVPAQAAWNAPFDITEIYPEEGFELSEILLTYTAFDGTPHKEESIDISSVSGSSKTIQLAGGGKPQSDVTVKVVFTAVKNPVKINYKFSGKPVEIADYYNVDLDALETGSIMITRDVTTLWEGDARTDTVSKENGIPSGSYVRLGRSYLHYDANFSISGVSVTNNGFPVEVTELDGYYYFYMPYVADKTDCIITVNYTNLDEYSFYLSDKATGDAEIKDVTFRLFDGSKWATSPTVTTAKPGDSLAAVFTGGDPVAPTGVTGALTVYAVYTDSDGVTHRVKTEKKSDYWIFTVASMPVPPTVAIEYAFENEAKEITYTNTDGSVCEFWVDGEQVVRNELGKLMVTPGKTVTVVPVVSKYPAGMVPVSITVPGASVDKYTFVMPNADAAVTVSFSEALTVAIDPAVVSDLVAKADYTITTSMGTRTNESQYAYNGETVRLVIMPKSGYELVPTNIKAYEGTTEITVYPAKDADGNPIPNEFDITLGTSSIVINGFAFNKTEQKVTWRYESSFYDKCTLYKNDETVPMTSGTSTLGANDVITVKGEGGAALDGYVLSYAQVNYLTADNLPGTWYFEPTNESITILDVPASDIEIVLTLERVAAAYKLDYKDNSSSSTDSYSLTVDDAVWDEAGKVYEDEWVSFTLSVRYDKKLDMETVKLTYKDVDGNPQTVPLSEYSGAITGPDTNDYNTFSNNGLEQVYSGYFIMPGGETTIEFTLTDTKTFNIEDDGYVTAYDDMLLSNEITKGTLGTKFYVYVPKYEGYTVSAVKATYYVHDATKPNGDSKTVTGTFVTGSGNPAVEAVLYEVTIPAGAASLYNTVYLSSEYTTDTTP